MPTSYSSKVEIVEQHLRREVEEGHISWNDYERTKRLLATDYTLLATASGLSASAMNVYYGRWYRKRPWPWTITVMSTPLAFMAGLVIPVAFRAVRYWNFQNSLEDQKGLHEALARVARQHQESTAQPSEPRDGADNSISGQPDAAAGGKQNRWVELRKASASASNSTWDKIRQSHEQSGVPSTGSRDQEVDSGSRRSGFDDRRTEQAKFDALLEAERKMFP